MIEELARGNVIEVKVVLASIVAALAIYQVVLMAVGYGRIRIPFLAPGPASRSHRAIGDTVVFLTLLVALVCVLYADFDDDAIVHVVAGSLLVIVLGVKVVCVRSGQRLGRFLPVLGLSALVLFLATWASSAGAFLIGGPT